MLGHLIQGYYSFISSAGTDFVFKTKKKWFNY